MSTLSQHSFRPRVESLEARDVPAAVVEPFDAPLGALPAGWAQWSSNGESAFRVAVDRVLRGAGALEMMANPSNLVARAWNAAPIAADAQVSASIYLSSLIPTEVLTRGRALDTDRPSYYALSLARGLDAQLVRVVDGVATPLASIRSASWLSQKWVVATLEADGTTVRGRIYRPDTDQYLSASGVWQSGATWALEVKDATLTGSGLAGVGRPASYAGTVSLDDFTVTPKVAPAAEAFDATPAGSLPSGWAQYSSTGGTPFAASAIRSLSAPQSLTISGVGSTTAARAWPAATPLADVEASASVYVDGLIPAHVFGRGQNLDTNTPSFYAVAVSRGLQVQLLRTQNGIVTTLGQVDGKEWTTDVWIRATLYVNGTNLRAQIFRPDRGQYLSNTGRWQETPTWAINLSDAALTGSGFAGVGRPVSYAGALSFDDFRSVPAVGDNVAPTVAITSPAAGATVSGVITVRATAADNLGVVRAEFHAGSGLRAVATVAPYAWNFDTRLLPNGPNAISVIVYDASGNVARSEIVVTAANNQDVHDPVIPKHLPSLRNAMLFYRGTPLGDLEQRLLRDAVDLVIADVSQLTKLRAVAPNTPLLAYSNSDNIYDSLLTDWLAYADARGASRESAFYHVGRATAFSGGSPSSRAVNRFWGVYVYRTVDGRWLDRTSTAAGTTTEGVAFGGSGESLAVGSPEKFREINLSLLSPAQRGWAAQLEYVTAVDAAGTPTTWAPLRFLADGTFRFSFSGTLTFDPPADWKAASLGGSARLFYVRWRTTAAGTAPVARSLLGRDYVNARGTLSGTIPAFDFAADANRDGYLDNAEYARRSSGFDARFVYETRAFYGHYGQMRFATNPADTAFRGWAVDYHRRLVRDNPAAGGVFMDNSEGRAHVPTTVREATDAFGEDYASMLNDVARALAPRWVLANTAGGGALADPVVRQTTGTYEEFLLRPLAHTYDQFEETALVTKRLAARTPSPYLVMDSLPQGGSPTDPRTQLATLAYYYLLADPQRTFLNFFGGFEPSSMWSRHWIEAAAYDIGTPAGDWRLFADGGDPSNSALKYRVYGRDYGKALVLYKPLSTGSGQRGGLGDETTTTHILNGTYRPLLVDGTLGAAVTSVTLRNGEGAILVRA